MPSVKTLYPHFLVPRKGLKAVGPKVVSGHLPLRQLSPDNHTYDNYHPENYSQVKYYLHVGRLPPGQLTSKIITTSITTPQKNYHPGQ